MSSAQETGTARHSGVIGPAVGEMGPVLAPSSSSRPPARTNISSISPIICLLKGCGGKLPLRSGRNRLRGRGQTALPTTNRNLPGAIGFVLPRTIPACINECGSRYEFGRRLRRGVRWRAARSDRWSTMPSVSCVYDVDARLRNSQSKL
jgi:hypothetical protein